MLSLMRVYTGFELILAVLALLITLVVSLSAHEYAHAYAAYLNGDDTAKRAGRLTLNPKNHLDPFGFFAAMLFGFGWAKPVPVNSMRFRKYKKGMAWVSVSGVLVNLVLALVFGGLYVVLFKYIFISNNFLFLIYQIAYFMLVLNSCLFVFNLLPIYPLDGFNLVSTFLKYDNKYVQFMRQYGHFVLIGVLILLSSQLTALINAVITPILRVWWLIL